MSSPDLQAPESFNFMIDPSNSVVREFKKNERFRMTQPMHLRDIKGVEPYLIALDRFGMSVYEHPEFPDTTRYALNGYGGCMNRHAQAFGVGVRFAARATSRTLGLSRGQIKAGYSEYVGQVNPLSDLRAAIIKERPRPYNHTQALVDEAAGEAEAKHPEIADFLKAMGDALPNETDPFGKSRAIITGYKIGVVAFGRGVDSFFDRRMRAQNAPKE